MAQRRIVDLSVFLENDVLSDPPPLAPRIEYQAHKDTGRRIPKPLSRTLAVGLSRRLGRGRREALRHHA